MIYLDLEETIIKSWYDMEFINYGKIRKFFKDNEVREIGIYSFAIQNEKEREEFNSWLKLRLEELLEVEVIKVLTVPEIQASVNDYERIEYNSMFEFIQLNGKYFSFLKYCYATHQDERCILIDDCVPTSITTTGSTIIRTINIRDLNDCRS